jgi:16S rRNA (adenine1518-N6/adenine1519-N6)-dimethyltransferase
VKLSDMREILAKREIQLTKSLGQNFLHDQNQLQRIVAAAELSEDDKVLEIGPGLGPLTKLLLEKSGGVLAIEKDARLEEFLREHFTAEIKSNRLELLHADALKFLEDELRDWRDWKLVANLPYSVASPLLVELACGARSPKKIAVTLQSEVAQRLMAGADDDDYGILTLLVQLDFAPRDSFRIPGTCFFPEPDVVSACVVLERRAEPLLPEDLRASYTRIVKRAFSQRRKMMMKLLKADWPEERLKQAFAELKISPQERAEKLGLEQFVQITKLLATEAQRA